MKKLFNFDKAKAKTAVKNGAITTTATTLGILHFAAQGTADILKETEAAIIHKINPDAEKSVVKRIRHKSYLKNKAHIGIAYCKTMIALEDAKDKLGDSIDGMKSKIKGKAKDVADAVSEQFNDGPAPMPQMTAEQAFDLANDIGSNS